MSYLQITSVSFLQTVVNSPQYPQFLAEAMRVFLKILEEGEPQFIAEQPYQVGGYLVFGIFEQYYKM